MEAVMTPTRPPEQPDEATRVRMAARLTTDAQTLLRLANDPATTVRAAVALNPAYAEAADKRLVADADERVRSLLATKMARLLPGLSGPAQQAAQTHVHTMLRTLANDATVRVRAAIAEALTNVAEAPRDIILTLAHDPEGTVSDPVLRFSPLLTDADLLELLATPPTSGTATAVASRAGLSSTIADTIAQHADSPALVALLSNRSATIQETTLDALVGRAGDHPEWHEPLICRPMLPVRSIRALSLIVARHLLDGLLNRADVPPTLADELRHHVAQSLGTVTTSPTEAEILESIRQMNAEGRLNEQTLLETASSGDARQTAAILAVASGVTLQTIDRAVALRSAKALVSLSHRAGFSMQAGMAIQQLLGQLGPGEILVAAQDGGCPLTASEVDWQIELLCQPGR